jgi:hypothetical protein
LDLKKQAKQLLVLIQVLTSEEVIDFIHSVCESLLQGLVPLRIILEEDKCAIYDLAALIADLIYLLQSPLTVWVVPVRSRSKRVNA